MRHNVTKVAEATRYSWSPDFGSVVFAAEPLECTWMERSIKDCSNEHHGHQNKTILVSALKYCSQQFCSGFFQSRRAIMQLASSKKDTLCDVQWI